MKKINIESLLGQTIYIGIDVHKKPFMSPFGALIAS